jgi:hypothetical protein
MPVLLSAYWLAFVRIAIEAGHNPGFVSHFETAPYPTQGAVVLCVVLAMLVASLGVVLRPPTRWRRWLRLVIRALYVGIFIVLTLPAGATDLAGIYYVPAIFSLATFLVLAVGTVWRVGATIMAHWQRPAP